MPIPRRLIPPFSPVQLAGFAARPLPPALLQPGLALAMRTVVHRHPGLFERLAGVGAPSFLIDPVELPFAFLLETDPEHPRLRALSGAAADKAGPTATIRGPLLRLIDLLEGRVDGDSLFFSRDLVIEGQTEAIVALRNAIDDAEIDILDDLLSPLGPLAAPASRVARGAGTLVARATRDLEALRDALIAPALRRTEARAAEPHGPEEPIEPLKKPDRSRGRTRRVAPKRPQTA